MVVTYSHRSDKHIHHRSYTIHIVIDQTNMSYIIYNTYSHRVNEDTHIIHHRSYTVHVVIDQTHISYIIDRTQYM